MNALRPNCAQARALALAGFAMALSSCGTDAPPAPLEAEASFAKAAAPKAPVLTSEDKNVFLQIVVGDPAPPAPAGVRITEASGATVAGLAVAAVERPDAIVATLDAGQTPTWLRIALKPGRWTEGTSLGKVTVAAPGAIPVALNVHLQVREMPRTLAVVTQPAGAVADRAFAVQPVLRFLKDDGSAFDTDEAVLVGLEGPGGALLGTGVVPAVHGVAAFTDLGISAAGSYVVVFGARNTAPARVPLTVVPPPQPLTVSRSGSGVGSVVSAPAGIACGDDCVREFPWGTAVTLTATPGEPPLSYFAGWTGACSGTGLCVLTLDAPKAVGALFEKVTHPLTVVRTGEGRVVSSPVGIDCGVACSARFDALAQVTLTATPAPGYVFAGWAGACSGNTSCTVAMTAAAEASAVFVPSLTVVRTGTGGGTVVSTPPGISCGSDCSEPYPLNYTVTLTATPDAHSYFAGWTGACSGLGVTCTVFLSEARTVTASFMVRTYALTVTRTLGGRVTSSPAGLDCGTACSAVFPSPTQVALTAVPEPGFTFDGWSGACTGNGPCVVTMSQARTVHARFSAVLDVTGNGTGVGNVTSAPPGISCGTSCAARFEGGVVVVLTATPATGSAFAGWSGACSGSSGNTCTVSMDAAKSVAATFTSVAFALTVSRSGEGTVSSSPPGISCGSDCGEGYPSGTAVTLTATPAAGWSFSGWSGACAGTMPWCTVTMDAAKGVTATFTRITYSLTVTRTGDGTVVSQDGGIACGSDCAETYAGGTAVVLTATPAPGMTFVSWTGACSGSGACVVTMDAAKSVGATFNLPTYALAVARAGSGGGSVVSSPPGIDCGPTCSATWPARTTVSLAAVPDATSVFGGWSGACTGTGGCTLTLDANKAVTATFNRVTYLLTVTRTGGGSVTSTSPPGGITCGTDCTEAYLAGTVVALTATADAGATFAGWSGACTGTGPCAVAMDAAKFVGARFTALLSVARTGSGFGTVTSSPAGINCGTSCAAAFDGGVTVTLTANPASGSTFAGWSGACAGTSGTCTVTMDGTRAVTASFASLGYDLTVTRTGLGAVSSSPAGISCGTDCAETYPPGTAVTLTATPAAGWAFMGWGNACQGTNGCAVTMSQARAVSATFAQIPYALTVARLGTGGGTVKSAPAGIDCGTVCAATWPSGSAVSLSAVPDATSVFSGWSGACTGTGACTLTLDADKAVAAAFTRVTYLLTVTRTGIGTVTSTSPPGGITCGTDCQEPYVAGSTVTLTAAAGAGSTFTGWAGACTGTLPTCTVAMDRARSVSAAFSESDD